MGAGGLSLKITQLFNSEYRPAQVTVLLAEKMYQCSPKAVERMAGEVARHNSAPHVMAASLGYCRGGVGQLGEAIRLAAQQGGNGCGGRVPGWAYPCPLFQRLYALCAPLCAWENRQLPC